MGSAAGLLARPGARIEGTAVKTHLLMLVQNRVGRGTYWRALGFAQELARLDYEVTLLAVAPNRRRGFSQHTLNGVHIVESPDLLPRSGYDPWDALNRMKWVWPRPFDLIHAFETRPVNLFPALLARWRLGVPLLTDWCDWFGRGGSVEQRPNPLLRTLLRPVETFFEEYPRPRSAGTTVINTALQQKALMLGVPAERLLLLPNGANVTGIVPQNKQAMRQKLGLPEDAFILGYTGALFLADAQLMAPAFDLIHAAHPQVKLLLIGYTNLAVEEMVQAKTAVLRTGPVSHQELADYVAACDAGWLPLADNAANRGRFPMKVHDFMAAGRPLIVSNVGDLGNFVQSHSLGYVTPAEPVMMAQSITDILTEPAAHTRMGLLARHVAETEYAWPVVSARLARFYERLL